MKCEKCGNEATYYYRETINGKTTERHLCSACAQEEGLDRAFNERSSNMLLGINSLMDDFFSAESDYLFPSVSRLTRALMAPAFTIPRIEIGFKSEPRTDCPSAGEEQNIASAEPNAELEDRLKKKRKVNALRQQLQEAVSAENYEKAIEIRDRIRGLEK